MAVNPPRPLVRTNYLDPNQVNYATYGNPDSAGFKPESVLPRSGATSHGEAKVDMEQYFRPIERLHASGSHGPGIAWGLKVSANIGDTSLTIAPGMIIDAYGRHAYLAQDGQAEIGPTADQPNVNPNLVPVTAGGAALPTGNLSGDYFVTMRWWETFDSATYINSGGVVVQFDDTPWLQLIPGAGYDPDVHVVLAKVSLDANSKLTALSYGDQGGLQRFQVSLPAQSVKFRRATNAAGPAADSAAWGEVSAREGGGLQILVANGNDRIDVSRAGGGNFGQMNVTANQMNVGQLNKPGIVLDGANANVLAGAPGNEGDVLVFDASSRLTIALNGATGHVIIGAKTLPGQLRMIGGQEGQDRLRLDGSTGAAVVQRIDAINGSTVEVTSNLAIDGILMGNPARKVQVVWMFSTDGVPDSQDVDLGSPRQFTAYACLVVVNSTTDFDYDNGVFADIAAIDGNPLSTWISGNGSNFGGMGDQRNTRWPAYQGFGQVITFRSIGFVFYE
jgi:hypothetical protein